MFGRTEERTGIVPFMNLATQVMNQEPYASAKHVFWIVDNGSSIAVRRRPTSPRRPLQRHGTAVPERVRPPVGAGSPEHDGRS
ncbi:hypothetical protein OG780_42355 [Streptomyces sp. NBC_00386]|uniref:hypothetical protein n=1 Tax=Streptomyces sp. NBC_00386 TaxID=2975734 RepID=UPI002E1E9A64